MASNGEESEFFYGIKNNASIANATPTLIVTKNADGTYEHATVANIPLSTAAINSVAGTANTVVKYGATGIVNSNIKDTGTIIEINNPTSNTIGAPADNFTVKNSIKGGLRVENTQGEALIINTTQYVAGESHLYDANVLAIQNKSTIDGVLAEVPAAIRFISNVDGEVGAVGFQNGGAPSAFENSVFLAASLPYYPGFPLAAPTRLVLIQEGDYLGNLTKIDRLEFKSDWTTTFKKPDGTSTIKIPVTGRVLINTDADNNTDQLQIDGTVSIGGFVFTAGGDALLGVKSLNNRPFTFGLSNTDALYLRRFGIGSYQFQTTTGSNDGAISFQSFGGRVLIGSQADNNTDTLQITGSTLITGVIKNTNLAGTGDRNLLVEPDGTIKAGLSVPKVYNALLSQSGLNAPTASIISNTLGGVPVWGYTSAGEYTLTLLGTFTSGKTLVFATIGANTAAGDTSIKCFLNTSTGEIILNTTFNAAFTNILLTNASFKIEVYP